MPDIIETSDIAQGQAEDGVEDWDVEPRTDAVASHEEKPGGISFHVQMRDWTVEDMEELIVEAAARIIVGRNGDNKLAKMIEDRALALITERANKRLATVAEDVLGTALTPKGYSQASPVTIGETLGMLGREYLEQVVRPNGEQATDYYERQRGMKRVEWILQQAVGTKFEAELKASSEAFLRDVRADIKARHEAMLAAEKARISEALAKL